MATDRLHVHEPEAAVVTRIAQRPPKDWLAEGVDYKTPDDALQEAHDELEGVCCELEESLLVRGCDPYGKGGGTGLKIAVPPPTLSDIGALWAFTDAVTAQLDQLESLSERLLTLLVQLNLARLDHGPASRAERLGQ